MRVRGQTFASAAVIVAMLAAVGVVLSAARRCRRIHLDWIFRGGADMPA